MDARYDDPDFRPKMYDGFESRYPIVLDGMVKDETVSMQLLDSAPYMPGGRMYMQMLGPYLIPESFTDWRDETLAWHLSCTINATLNPVPIATVKGPDALRFLKDALVNKLDKFPVGTTKHGVMCLDDGLITKHGVLFRTAEDEYEANFLSPYLEYLFEKGDYDAKLWNSTNDRVMYQTQGPRSLEMVERAAHEDLHDLKFCHFRDVTIAGHVCRVLRFGMYGTLGYEVHAPKEGAHDVYVALVEAGNPLGLRRMGMQSYMMDHTSGGSQQAFAHFLPANDPEFLAKQASASGNTTGGRYLLKGSGPALVGSLGTDPAKRQVNPYMIGLDYVCDYSRDFRGKEALLEYKERPDRRSITTLEWNHEDLADIYESQYRDEEPYAPMDWAGRPWSATTGGMCLEMDKVLDEDGREIGYSAGRTTDAWYRAMVSLASIEESYIHEGDEVTVVWGDSGTRQKKVRAKIARFPYNRHFRNKGFDVDQIQHPKLA